MQFILLLRIFSYGEFHVWAQTTNPFKFDRDIKTTQQHLSCAFLKTKCNWAKMKVINMMIIILTIRKIDHLIKISVIIRQ